MSSEEHEYFHEYPPQNRILLNLELNAPQDYVLLRRHREEVDLSVGQQLEGIDQKIEHLYFLESGMASVVAGYGDYQSEIGMVGREGMTGLPFILDADRSTNDVVVRVEGHAWRIAADDLQLAIDESRSLTRHLLRYAHVFMVQCAQTALANECGTLEQRLARWLLMALGRLDEEELAFTQEFLAQRLGVHRPNVAVALQKLKNEELISTEDGRISIVNFDGLEKSANGLFGAPEAEVKRLFPEFTPWPTCSSAELAELIANPPLRYRRLFAAVDRLARERDEVNETEKEEQPARSEMAAAPGRGYWPHLRAAEFLRRLDDHSKDR